MARGEFNVFKVELHPDFGQRKAWKAVEGSAFELYRTVLRRMIQAHRTIGAVCAESLFMKDALAEAADGPLLELSVAGIVRDAHECVSGLAKASSDLVIPHRSRPSPILEVPKEDVIFATSEPTVRVPYLGLVRYKHNQRITWDHANHPVIGSESKLEKNAQLRRAYVGVVNNAHCLIMDCSPPGAKVTVRAKDKPSVRNKKLPDLLQ